MYACTCIPHVYVLFHYNITTIFYVCLSSIVIIIARLMLFLFTAYTAIVIPYSDANCADESRSHAFVELCMGFFTMLDTGALNIGIQVMVWLCYCYCKLKGHCDD